MPEQKQHQPLTELRDRERVSAVYLCGRKSLQSDRNGRRFLSLQLCDNTGMMEALLWEQAEQQSGSFESGEPVRVSGQAVSYQGRLQLHLTAVARAAGDEIQPEALFRRSQQAPETMWEDLRGELQRIADPHLGALVSCFLDDETFRQQFLRAPAARTIHHAYLGGLLEHTLSVLRLARLICDHYAVAKPMLLNRDLCLVGAFLHDLGKLEEISSEWGFSYTDRGRLIGHLVLGVQLLEQKLAGLPEFPPALADHLRHILLAHHGKLEFGSPKRPKTAEALVVHRADELDGRLGSLADVFALGKPGWTSYLPHVDQCFFNGWPSGDPSGSSETEKDGDSR